VLAVSTPEPRKNLDGLLEGFRRSGLEGLELVVVGAGGWGGVDVEGDRVRHLTDVDDEELAQLYRGAAAVAYVSLYEGFGLPVLEAMASGRPVVAPAGPPYDEFSEGIAFQVNPRDPDSIAQGLQQAVASVSQPVGIRRAADFTWERVVQAHVDLYRELAS
jgi:glycosyltransferase involved in cell wall biosynthesis